MEQHHLTEKAPFDTYNHSIHGQAMRLGQANAAICSDCHGTHDLHKAANPKSKVNRSNISQTCGRCHENVKLVFDQSVHGVASKAGIKEAPVCTDCHGEHSIRSFKDPASSVYAGAITKTCSNCHESERINAKFGLPSDRLKTYRDSYHGLATKLGDLSAANCASCHGWHDVLPSVDTRSSIHPKNLPMTCGKCHSGVQPQFFKGTVHGENHSSENFWIRLVTIFYSFAIPFVIGFMVIHNAMDFLRKTIKVSHEEIVHPKKELSLIRMNPNERVQHLLLTLSFSILVYTGFSLKYPEMWWAYPFKLGGEVWRKGVHRWTALVFCLTGLLHVFYMIGTRRGRFILRNNLLPKIRDIFDPFKVMAYNLGFRKDPVNLGYPSYIERSEYWALIWGSLIMILSGSLLVFNNVTLKYFPVWISNFATIVHFYEAVLATLSILVWHFYWTIFDPHVYPMNMSWLIGTLRGKKTNKKGDNNG